MCTRYSYKNKSEEEWRRQLFAYSQIFVGSARTSDKKRKILCRRRKATKNRSEEEWRRQLFPYSQIFVGPARTSAKTRQKKEEKTQMKKQLHAKSIQCSQAVTHPSTDWTQRCLTSVIGRELVCSAWYGPWLSRGVSFGLLQAHGSLLG